MRRIPLFDLYAIDDLAHRLGYELSYLVNISKGWQQPSPRFKRTCCAVLGKGEVELFGEEEGERERSKATE